MRRNSLALRTTACLIWIALIVVPSRPGGQNPTPGVKESYSKTEHMIPMRDGVKLFFSVYAPKDTSQRYPIMLSRTPYSCAPYGPEFYKESIGPSPLFQNEGYIFVYEDVRGAWMSEGTYVN